jgi:ferric-dicitrate binding protein FerR (iron transport regulator)
MSDDDVVALAAAHVEGELDPVSRSHLAGLVRDDEQLASVLSDQVRMHLLLHAVLSSSQPSVVVQRARLIAASFNPQKKRQLIASAQALRPGAQTPPSLLTSRRWWVTLSASAAVIASVMTVVLWSLLQMVGARVEEPAHVVADVGVRIVRGTGQSSTTLQGPLLPGDTIMTAANQHAELVYQQEATHLVLSPHTRVQALSGSGKRFRLEQGEVTVQAAPQPQKKPMMVLTPHADVTVIGTAFQLASSPYLTWLSVEHGSVLIRQQDQQELVVTSGQRALAADRLSIIPQDRGCGLIGEYYQGRDFNHLKIKRLDPVIDFDWETDEPAPGISHPFSVRWTGMIEARYAETYRIFLPSDDGVRLWIDDRLVYDNWRIQSYQENDRRYGTFTFSPERMRVPIRIEYFEQNTFAIIRMSWVSTSQPRQLIPATAFYPEGM